MDRGEGADLAYGWCAATRFCASCGSPSAAVRSGSLPVFPPPWSGTTVRPSVPAFPLRLPGGAPPLQQSPLVAAHHPLQYTGHSRREEKNQRGDGGEVAGVNRAGWPRPACSDASPRLRESRRRSWPSCHFQAPHRPRGEEKRIAWRWKLLGAVQGANAASHNPRHPPGRAATAQRERCPKSL